MLSKIVRLSVLCGIIFVVSSKWLSSSVSLSLDTPSEEAYLLYSDLTQQPTWSPWLTSVQVLDKNTGLSKWTLKKLGLEYSWSARNVDCENVQNGYSVCWESIDGLPNKGQAGFYTDGSSKTTMTLTVRYDLPGVAAFVLKSLGSYGQRFIESTLLADLVRFNERLSRHKKQRECGEYSDSRVLLGTADNGCSSDA